MIPGLRETSNVDDQNPSLFELLSADRLTDLVPSCLHYVLTILTRRYPRYLLKILNSFDEIYLVLQLVIERHQLRRSNASFLETYHGFVRQRVPCVPGGDLPLAQEAVPDSVKQSLRLNSADRARSLVCLVGVSYLKRKLDNEYDRHIAQLRLLGRPEDSLHQTCADRSLRTRLVTCYKWFLRTLYPNIRAAGHLLSLAMLIAYLSRRSKYHSLTFWLLRCQLKWRALSAKGEELAYQHDHLENPLSGRAPVHGMVQSVQDYTMDSLRHLLPLSVLSLQFIEWWHSSDFAHQVANQAVDNIQYPPPNAVPDHLVNRNLSDKSLSASRYPVDKPISKLSGLPVFTIPIPKQSPSGLCPICLHSVQTPTLTQTGYIYCYACIYKWLDGNHYRQIAFMSDVPDKRWPDDRRFPQTSQTSQTIPDEDSMTIRFGTVDAQPTDGVTWENGQGRCPISGVRILGGTASLRRLML